MSIQFNGDLIVNGGFEEGLVGWTATNVGLGGVTTAHEGLTAADMGLFDNTIDAFLSQTVRVVPSQFYKLYFHVSGIGSPSPDLEVTIDWLDFANNVIGSALTPSPLFLHHETIGQSIDGEWKFVTAFTNRAPFAAASARITFHKLPGIGPSALTLDDVVFGTQ